MNSLKAAIIIGIVNGKRSRSWIFPKSNHSEVITPTTAYNGTAQLLRLTPVEKVGDDERWSDGGGGAAESRPEYF